ncbi:Gastrula zinc finger protein xFG20 1 [Fasciola gigantica]|uniref:Gastrula zinc finger protein xFG20 1 n=1 Tax=Fasciola gigantica TaxID=46835 RepID=A0A504Z227_FASGI|nr:Gastrula zinc finger protein xFG20 1 [Fasciola gigantica]
MDFTGFTVPWFGFGEARLSSTVTFEEAVQLFYRHELKYRSMNEVNTRLDCLLNQSPQQVPLEQDAPINLCLRDQHNSEHSRFSADVSDRTTARALDWFNQFIDSKSSCMPTKEWTEELHSAMSQTDSGVVETDTESTSHISPPTSHFVVVASTPTNSNALFTSTPRRRGLGTPCPRKQESKEEAQQSQQQVSAMTRSSTAIRMSGRQAQLSTRCTRRRRVGWRGVAMCAACGMVCSGMDHLNGHFALFHLHLLGLEWKLSQYNSTKTSKLLFQAQLDRLISEKLSDNASSSCPTSPLRPDVHLHSPKPECPLIEMEMKTDNDIKQFSSSESKCSSAETSPSPSRLNSSNVDTRPDLSQTPDLYASGSMETQRRTPLLPAVELGQHVPNKLITVPDPTGEGDRHGGTRSKGYPCPRCKYTAKWPTELQKHVMVHANSRPFVCCVCSTSYKWSWDLGRHFSNAHPGLLNPYKRIRVTRHGSNVARITTAPTTRMDPTESISQNAQ